MVRSEFCPAKYIARGSLMAVPLLCHYICIMYIIGIVYTIPLCMYTSKLYIYANIE